MNDDIIQFFQGQTCATICCIDTFGKPYCFTCFYAFNAEDGLLYYKTSPQSNHALMMTKNPCVAGTVLPDKLNKLVVKGIQFEATVLDDNDPGIKKDTGFYHRKNPLALAMPGEVWALKIDSIKMTDSTKLFGKKITWKRIPTEEGN